MREISRVRRRRPRREDRDDARVRTRERHIVMQAPTVVVNQNASRETGSIARAIAVRVGMVALVMRPNLIVPAACATCAKVALREKIRADFERARARGEVDREVEAVMEMKTRREEVTFGQEEATAIMEATATATERLASVAEWRSRTVSAAAMYAAMVMSVMSLFIPARTVMCWGLLYATRPKRMRIVPDPLTSCWSRLPTKAREASKIQ